MEDMEDMANIDELELVVDDPNAIEEDPAPDDLLFEDQPLSLEFHPTLDLFATGLVSGAVSVFRVGLNENECVYDGSENPLHQAAARCVRFDGPGDFLFTSGTDMALNVLDVNTWSVVRNVARAHLKPVSSMCVFGSHMCCSGDESGMIKLWDMRAPREVWSCQPHQDYISDMASFDGRHAVAVAGGDGMLSVINTRRLRVEHESWEAEDELLSVKWMSEGQKVVVGTQEGALVVWSAQDWEATPQRMRGHPESVDALAPVDDDTIVTGSSDGILRLVQVNPCKLMGVLGEHGDFPIETLTINSQKTLLASTSHDSIVKFWNISYLFDDDDDDAMDVEKKDDDDDDDSDAGLGEEGPESNSGKYVAVTETKESKGKSKKRQFFSGLG